MADKPYGKTLRTQSTNGNKVLDNVPDLYYKVEDPINLDESEKNMGSEPNFDLGGKPVRVDNGSVLDPRLISIVKALARWTAEEDFEAAMKKQRRESP